MIDWLELFSISRSIVFYLKKKEEKGAPLPLCKCPLFLSLVCSFKDIVVSHCIELSINVSHVNAYKNRRVQWFFQDYLIANTHIHRLTARGCGKTARATRANTFARKVNREFSREEHFYLTPSNPRDWTSPHQEVIVSVWYDYTKSIHTVHFYVAPL